jgi:hypothetical protein
MWGTYKTIDLEIPRYQYENIEVLMLDIHSTEQSLANTESQIKMLVAATPSEIWKSTDESILWYMDTEIKNLLENYREEIVFLTQLQLLYAHERYSNNTSDSNISDKSENVGC